MATQKNAIYKVHNGTDFDEINFKTIAEQIFMKDGRNAETAITEKMKKGYLNETSFMGNSGGNYALHATNINVNAGESVLICITTNYCSISDYYYSGIHLAHCKEDGTVRSKPIVEHSNGISILIQSLANNKLDIKNGVIEPAIYKPNINIIKLV